MSPQYVNTHVVEDDMHADNDTLGQCQLSVDGCGVCNTPAGASGDKLDCNLTAIAQVHSKVNRA